MIREPKVAHWRVGGTTWQTVFPMKDRRYFWLHSAPLNSFLVLYDKTNKKYDAWKLIVGWTNYFSSREKKLKLDA